MNKQILADYYEEKGFIRKAQRLRKHKSLVIFGNYIQYRTSGVLRKPINQLIPLNGTKYYYMCPNGLGYSHSDSTIAYGNGEYFKIAGISSC